MSRTRRVFPESFKHEAVDRVVASGLSGGAVARELGLHETVLLRWMTQFGAPARRAAWRSNTQVFWSHLRSYVTAMRPKPSISWNPESVSLMLTAEIFLARSSHPILRQSSAIN